MGNWCCISAFWACSSIRSSQLFRVELRWRTPNLSTYARSISPEGLWASYWARNQAGAFSFSYSVKFFLFRFRSLALWDSRGCSLNIRGFLHWSRVSEFGGGVVFSLFDFFERCFVTPSSSIPRSERFVDRALLDILPRSSLTGVTRVDGTLLLSSMKIISWFPFSKADAGFSFSFSLL